METEIMVMLQRTWKPDRDWNRLSVMRMSKYFGSCNELENPIGIETLLGSCLQITIFPLQRTWKPDRDWNNVPRAEGDGKAKCCNELENPIGIETKNTNDMMKDKNRIVATNLKTR